MKAFFDERNYKLIVTVPEYSDGYLALKPDKVTGTFPRSPIFWRAHVADNDLFSGVLQGSKKPPSGRLGQVDFPFGQVTFSPSFPDGQGPRQAVRRLNFW